MVKDFYLVDGSETRFYGYSFPKLSDKPVAFRGRTDRLYTLSPQVPRHHISVRILGDEPLVCPVVEDLRCGEDDLGRLAENVEIELRDKLTDPNYALPIKKTIL